MKHRHYIDMGLYEDSYWWFLAKRKFMATFLSSGAVDGRLLDVGCGTGGTTRFLSSFGETTGLEISPAAIDIARGKGLVNMVRGDANALPFADASFDVVTMNDLLYHEGIVEDKALSAAHRVLCRKGRLLIMDCALPVLMGRHDAQMGARKRFKRHELQDLVARHGFRILRVSYVFMLTLPILMMVRWIDSFQERRSTEPAAGCGVKPLPSMLNRFLLGLSGVEQRLLSMIDLPIGSSLMILAEKK